MFHESWAVSLQDIAQSLNIHGKKRIFYRNILHLSYVEDFLLHLKRFEDAVLSRKKRGRKEKKVSTPSLMQCLGIRRERKKCATKNKKAQAADFSHRRPKAVSEKGE